MTTNPTHIAAPPGELHWRYEIPENRSAKVQLLTVGGIAVHGHWYGAFGEAFIAWCPLPKRDKELEARLRLI